MTIFLTTESSFDVTSTTSNIPSDDRLDIREKVVMDKLPASVSSSFDGAARTITTTSDIGEYRAEDIQHLTHENKIWLLKHSFRPASNYKFPSKLEYGNGIVLNIFCDKSFHGCHIPGL